MNYDVKSQALPEIHAGGFDGPLDLLCFLIEKNKVNIYDIPIAEITDQYIELIESMTKLDLEIASEFLLMASTLLIIKSRMLLPSKQMGQDDVIDPREELVLKILEYRRCKSLADDLKTKHNEYGDCVFKLPEPLSALGISIAYNREVYDRSLFMEATRELSERNRVRFYDVSSRIAGLLKREKISIKDKMRVIWDKLTGRAKVFFNEIFPSVSTSRAERIVGFLALLELLKTDLFKVEQNDPFDVISIKRIGKSVAEEESLFDKLFSRKKSEETDYR